MKRSTKGILIVTIAVAIGFATVTVHLMLVVWEAWSMLDRARQGRHRLFYETDYDELLAACREMSSRVTDGTLEPKRYQVFFLDSPPDPNAMKFPEVILNLEPSFVRIDIDGTVNVELLPGPEYFGVFAYPEDRAGWGDVELIDDLWYYDSGYDTAPKYRTRIDRMIEEGRKVKAAGGAVPTEP